MRRAIDVLILIAILGGVGWAAFMHQNQVLQVGRQLSAKFLPCKNPITYSLGSVDARFGVSKTTFIADLKEAESIWEKSSDKNLFEYKREGGDVVINLIYDYRQQASDKMAALGINIDQSMSSYNALKAQYNILAARIVLEKKELNSHVAEYNAKQQSYNAEVAKWNRQGGAPPAQYNRLQAEQSALAEDAERIKAEGEQVNTDIDTLNAIGTSLNQLIVRLNLNVDKYNQAGASAGADFEEGEYVSEAGSQHIDIYEYSNHAELVRVLAHELGHALGLGHVADTEAIMYKINQGKSLALTKDDTAALHAQCSSSLF